MNKQPGFRFGNGGMLLLAIAMTVVAGCGRSTTVTGKVTYAGRPVIYGSVTIIDSARKAHSAAISPEGVYSLEGLATGPAAVAVISRDPSKGRSTVRNNNPGTSGGAKGAQAARPPAGWFPLPAKFESATTSGLTCTIAAGTTTHDIDLK